MATATLRQNRLAELAAEKRAELKAAAIALPSPPVDITELMLLVPSRKQDVNMAATRSNCPNGLSCSSTSCHVWGAHPSPQDCCQESQTHRRHHLRLNYSLLLCSISSSSAFTSMISFDALAISSSFEAIAVLTLACKAMKSFTIEPNSMN